MALPTNEEQELLQLINRFRADPAGEAARLLAGTGLATEAANAIASAISFFKVDTTLFTQQMATLSAAPPLAWNAALEDASAAHSAAMIGADSQSHQLPGEADLGTRVKAAGYDGWSTVGENIYAFASSAAYAHAGFVVDWGFGPGGMQTPPGHRDNLISPSFTEIGIDITPESNPSTSVGPLVVTQDLGNRFAYAPQFLGVVFADADGDSLYDAGEGRSGITVTAIGAAGTFTTTTWTSGGYQLAVPAGSYSVTFSGNGLGSYATTAVMAASNVAVDARTAQFAVTPVASIAADRTVAEAAVWIPYTVTLDTAPAAAASLRWSLADGSARLADGDMPPGQGGTLTFAPGQTSASFTVLVNDEAHKDEGSETFAIVLDQPAGLTLGDASATVTLTDTYVPPPAVALAMANTTKGTSGPQAMEAYAGPLSYLHQQFVFLGTDGIVLSAAAPNVFLRSGSGDDALQVAAGQNVMDAGSGSNFLTGGTGADTFFLDARGAVATIWSTVENLTAGDAVTLWGLSPTSHTLTWTDNLGAVGHQGLTMRASAPGQPEVLLTLAGLSDTDRTGPAPRFSVQYGFDTASSSDYLFLFATA